MLARSIGPVYSIDELARWLMMPGGDTLTPQAVRKRAEDRQLVGFLTDDLQFAFPAWQFDRGAGQLIPRSELISLWQQLPHGVVLSAVDLAAWMNTRSMALDGESPADRVGKGYAEELAAAVSRLRERASIA